MVRVRLSCCICTSSRCPRDPPGVTESEYAAVSGCGHVFHKACVEQWFNQQSKPICPICKTAYDVTCKTAGNRRVDKPLVKLWLDTSDGPSSDAFTQDTQVLIGQTYGRAKDKGKAKLVVPDDEEDEITGSDDEGLAAGDSNDVGQLRRQRNEAMQQVRQQREELERLRQLQDQSEELEQLRAQNRQLEEDVDTRDEQIVGLQADVDDMADQLHDLNADELEEAARDIEALEADIRAFQAENATLREREDDLSKETHDLKNTVRKLKEKLAVAGESGQEVIKQLGDDIADRDNEIMRLKARIDKFEDEMQAVKNEAKEKVETAREAAEAARKKAQKLVEASERSASVALADATAQRQLVEQLRGAHKKYALRLRKAKEKYKKLQEQRGVIVPGSSEEDDDLYAPPPPRASVSPSRSRQSSRAPSRQPLASTSTHNRRRLDSTSPAPQPFKINNNSTLFSPTRKKQQRNVFEPEVDDEEDHEAMDGARGTGGGAHSDSDSDDDIIFVEPAPTASTSTSASASTSTSRAPLRPTRSGSSSLARTVPSDRHSPPRLSQPSFLSPYFSTDPPAPMPLPMPMPTLTTAAQSSGGAAAGSAPPNTKRKFMASLASDRHLPDLGKGLVESGPKRKVKRK
ncbi:hypothetical protein JCM1840_006800 [Sporobolomyces johnsonii]